MPSPSPKAVRKLVTLPPELAERVERFRETSGASSESDALKTLIEDGLKLKDRPEDLLRRCESLTAARPNVADVVTLTSDHPLVDRAILDSEELKIHLKKTPDGEFRFRFSRGSRKWTWEVNAGEFDEQWQHYKPLKSAAQQPSGAGSGDLDDDIPF